MDILGVNRVEALTDQQIIDLSQAATQDYYSSEGLVGRVRIIVDIPSGKHLIDRVVNPIATAVEGNPELKAFLRRLNGLARTGQAAIETSRR